MPTLTPRISLSQLGRLRARERTFLFLWGLTCWLAFAGVILAGAMLIDWGIDRARETPRGVRVFLTLTQIILYAAAAWFLILRPLARGASLIRLARRAEENIPEFDHRLITAIQLTHENARTEGMSPELITAVTIEAEAISQRHDLASLADTRRLKRAGMLLPAPLVVMLGLIIFFGPALFFILLQRQLLIDRDIPRNIHLTTDESLTPHLWPAGDEVTIRYRVNGRIRDDRVGRVRVSPEGGPSDEYPLKFESRVNDDETIFAAQVPPSTVAFTFRAWLGDGRTKDASRIDFAPRPVVNRVDAWVRMPDYVGKKPDGSPYQTLQQQGEVIGLAGSLATVRIEASKPLAEARLILIARNADGVSERDLSTTPMKLYQEDNVAQGTFRLSAELLAYRIEVTDKVGFGNLAPPRRGVALAPDDPPHVALLPERFAGAGESATEETEVEGMPVPVGGAIRIAYFAQSALGLSRARLAYRINEGAWSYLPLKETSADEKSGPFDQRRGAFENSLPNDQVEFCAMPSADPTTTPNRTEGGGRFDFQTRALKKVVSESGMESKLEVGDRVEFYVEVFDQNPAPNRAPGRSDARIKGIVTDAQFVDWVVQTLQSEARIRQLEDKQRGIFRRTDEP